MIYAVFYDPRAEEQLAKLPNEVAQRIVKMLRRVAETGRGFEPLKDAQYGYRIRVGDYRLLVDITYNPHRLFVRYIDHRSRIYKRMV